MAVIGEQIVMAVLRVVVTRVAGGCGDVTVARAVWHVRPRDVTRRRRRVRTDVVADVRRAPFEEATPVVQHAVV